MNTCKIKIPTSSGSNIMELDMLKVFEKQVKFQGKGHMSNVGIVWKFGMKHSGSIPRNACVTCET